MDWRCEIGDAFTNSSKPAWSMHPSISSFVRRRTSVTFDMSKLIMVKNSFSSSSSGSSGSWIHLGLLRPTTVSSLLMESSPSLHLRLDRCLVQPGGKPIASLRVINIFAFLAPCRSSSHFSGLNPHLILEAWDSVRPASYLSTRCSTFPPTLTKSAKIFCLWSYGSRWLTGKHWIDILKHIPKMGDWNSPFAIFLCVSQATKKPNGHDH